MVRLRKPALERGASRGMGRATALALAETGAHVLAHYGRSVQEAQSLVESIHSKGGRADAIRADLGTREGATLLAKEVRSIVGKQLDVLVSNAGISKAATIRDHSIEDFDNLFATNVRSPFFLVQQLLPILSEGSTIIVVSSIGAHAVVGKPSLDSASILAYASTKGVLETSCQELGCASWPAWRSRKCCCARCDRYGHVQFHQNGSGPRGHARHAST